MTDFVRVRLPITIAYYMMIGQGIREVGTLEMAVWEYDALKEAGASNIRISDATGCVLRIGELRASIGK